MKGKLVGLGTAITHGNTAWLAHIIVSPENRNQGIGKSITKFLVDSLQNTTCTTIFLLATKLGEPVYKKAGFVIDTEYIAFMGHHTSRSSLPFSNQLITSFKKDFEEPILQLDRRVSGENREHLLKMHLEKSLLILDRDNVVGCFFPTLGEGLILAENTEAGLALLNKRHLTETRTMLPIDNKTGINFLLKKGFQEAVRGSRMRLGKKLEWQPEKIYSRIGGNLG